MSESLELKDVHAGYGRIEILHGMDITVPAGSVVALLGRNGVGKTTTLRTIAGTIPATSGSIRLGHTRIDGRRASSIASKGLVLVPEGRGVFPGLTVSDNLHVAHRSRKNGHSYAEFEEQIVKQFPQLGNRLGQQAGLLSGGEQQMLALARAMVGDPKVLMFDELSMGLAPLVVAQLFDKIAALRAEGRTIVLVEQYLTYALKLADLCYVLSKGKVAWMGEPSELRASPTASALLTA